MKFCIALAFIILQLSFLSSRAVAQYSTRYALLAGIGTYPAESGWPAVHGDRDVEMLAEELQKYSFLPGNIFKLVNRRASKDLILSSLNQLYQQVSSGDIVYIHFSGHFQQITDLNGDEADQLDECFAAWSAPKTAGTGYQGQQHLCDDDLGKSLRMLQEKLTRIGQLVLVFDGGMADGPMARGTSKAAVLPPALKTKGKIIAHEYERADFSPAGQLPYFVQISADPASPVNEVMMGSDTIGPMTAMMLDAFRKPEGLKTFGNLAERPNRQGQQVITKPVMAGNPGLEFWGREQSRRKDFAGTVDVRKNARMGKDNRVFALCVGVSDYPGKTKSLRFAHSDASSFYLALKQAYGDKLTCDTNFILQNEKASQARIFQLLDWVKKEIKPGDRMYFYFAGHGDVEGSLINKPTFFLLPGGSEISYSSGGHIPFDLLKNYLNTFIFNGAQVYLVVDACHSGNLAGGQDGMEEISDNLRKIDRGESVKILACRSNERSREGEEFGGGFGAFTWYMLRGVEGKADKDGNKEISVKEIRDFLADSVAFATANKQNPTVEGPLDIGFLPKPRRFSAEELARQKQARNLEQINQKTQQLESQFRAQLKKNNLIEPENSSALFWLNKLEEADPENEAKKKQWRDELSEAINNKTQNIINQYIAGNQNFAKQDVFRLGAREIAVFLDHNPSTHSLYPQMLARRYFFDAQALSPDAVDNDRDRRLLDSAISHLKTALIIENRAAHLYNAIGRLFGQIRKYDSAIHYYNKAIELAPKWKFPYNNKGAAYQEKWFLNKNSKNLFDSAISSFTKANELDRRFLIAIRNLGKLYYISSQGAQAKKLYQEACFADRKFAAAFHLLAVAYRNEQKLDSAFYVLEQGLSQNPDDLELNQEIGNCYYDLACLAEGMQKDSLCMLAIERYQKILKQQTENYDAMHGKSNVFLELNKLDSALIYSDKCISLDSSNILYHLNKADVFLRLNKLKELDALLIKLNQKFLDNQYVYLDWAQLWVRKKNMKKAAEFFVKARKAGMDESEIRDLCELSAYKEWATFRKCREFQLYRDALKE